MGMRADDVNGVDIELRDLRLAVVTSQHRSLRQAAEALNIRQSTLSRRLHEIERQLGVVLFERTNGGTRLTTVGLEFVSSAKRILDDVDTELRRLRSRSRGELGLLTIGVHASPSAGNMHATLVENHRRFPDVDVRTIDGSHDRLLCALAGNAVDVAIMTGQATAWDGRMRPLWSERVIVVFPEHHPLGENSRIRWADLANEKFLVPQQVKRYIADEKPGFPWRIEIRDAELGETLLLVSHIYQPADTPYRGCTLSSSGREKRTPTTRRTRYRKLCGFACFRCAVLIRSA